MDEKIITLLLDCLRRDVNPAERLIALTRDEWQSLLDLAEEQKIRGLLYHRLKSYGMETTAPQEVRHALQAAYRQNAVSNLGFLGDLNRVVAALHANDIPVIVLKGAYLAAVVYGHPALREMTDIDLLVPAGRLGQAAQSLETLGYKQKTSYRPEVDLQFTHHLSAFTHLQQSTVELHWTIARPSSSYSIDPGIDPNELWARAMPARIGHVDALGLSAEDLLLHLCLHASYHHRFEFGLRPSCDIAETILRFGDTLAWPQIVERACRWRWARGTYLALRLARELVGAAVPDEVLQQLQPMSFDETIVVAARSQIFTDRRLAYAISPKLARLRESSGLSAKMRELWHSVFLPRTEMAGRYGVSLTSPLFYLYYLVRLRALFSTYARMAFRLWRRDPKLSPVAQRKAILLNWLSEK